MKKLNIMIAALLMVFATVSLSAQSKSKTCSMSIEECAKKMGMSVDECKKVCAEKGMTMAELAEGETRVASASAERIVDLPACCYGSFTETGKACCEKYQTELASADKFIDADGNEFKGKSCAKSSKSCAKTCASKSSAKTQVASVVMVREAATEKASTAKNKKSCSRTCASKTSKA